MLQRTHQSAPEMSKSTMNVANVNKPSPKERDEKKRDFDRDNRAKSAL